ncbi:MAG: glycerate kinase [Spirochaetaceae bacterium]|jgi:glycerate kinase|nr:glycerate kinase [Spirochaetaceae bacterium]
MKKIILIPDSFKGTMSSQEICSIMEEQIRKYYPGAEVLSIPVADGGEGSVDSFLAAVGGEKITIPAKGPYLEDIQGFYGLVNGGNTAVIEMAACAGLPLAGERLQPDKTTTYGVGQLILDAAKRGCKKIVVGLGGSATNDFGAGAAAAAGVRFFDRDGKEFIPLGGTLSRIAKIDRSGMPPELLSAEIISMCDIDNPLYGPSGAAFVFAPQKGADAAMVEFLDRELRAVSEAVIQQLGIDVSAVPGAGAAGGMGGGMVVFFGSRLQMGIETVLDTVNFDRLLPGTDLVLTGEGKIDSQSLRGKVVIGVARRAKKQGIPVIAVVGDIGDSVEGAYDEGVRAIFSINRRAIPFQEARTRCRSDLSLTMDNLLRFLTSFRQGHSGPSNAILPRTPPEGVKRV